MKTIELEVKGLCCADCAANVKKTLKNIICVENLKVLMAAEKAVITYDELKTAPDKLIEKIEGLGYKVSIPTMMVTEKPEKKKKLARILRLTFISIITLLTHEYSLRFSLARRYTPLPLSFLPSFSEAIQYLKRHS
jgi:Cu+-exporting ATPase